LAAAAALRRDRSRQLRVSSAPHPANRERFQWLSTTIRSYKGDASVVEVQSIDNLTKPQLVAQFNDTRARDYKALIQEIAKITSSVSSPRNMTQLGRIRGRFQEIVAIDFFENPLQKRTGQMISNAESGTTKNQPAAAVCQSHRQDYQGKVWVTRPKPGIDRAASAWLILKFIDKKARFTFTR
jgi:Chromate resistance exported protein